MNIYRYINYIEILKLQIKLNEQIYGYKALMAEAAGCQRSYLSQVLKETHHLTLEHAWGLSSFWGLNSSEKEYFLNLIHLARAGNLELKAYYKQKLFHIKQDQENLGKRIKNTFTLPEPTLSQFYSQWYYLAVQIALTIPQLRMIPALSERLGLSKSTTELVLQNLIDMGLVFQDKEQFLPTESTIHTPRESLYATLNHQHWRNKAIENSMQQRESDIHYSLVCSLSNEDIEKIRQMVFQWIDESRKVIAPSKEEELYSLNIDWFKV